MGRVRELLHSFSSSTGEYLAIMCQEWCYVCWLISSISNTHLNDIYNFFLILCIFGVLQLYS